MYSTERSAGSAALTLAFVFALACVLFTGCVPSEAIEQARTEQAICRGVMKAPEASDLLREFATVEHDAWSAQRYSLEGEALPEDTVSRMRALGTLPEGWGE